MAPQATTAPEPQFARIYADLNSDGTAEPHAKTHDCLGNGAPELQEFLVFPSRFRVFA